MKSILRVLTAILFAAPLGAGAVVPGTVGSNLTAYNNNMGAINNNQWNAMTNARARAEANAPSADFGNCNALIMRCAQPKCAGCTTIDLAVPIVAGCVRSNEACAQYGDDLVQYMAAQLVANATAKNNAAAAAAAQNAAAQSAAQMQEMQMQMAQMQAEMAAQNAATVAELQNALEEQKQLTAAAIADASAQNAAAIAAMPRYEAPTETATVAASVATPVTAAGVTGALTDTQRAAAAAGVSADILVRETIVGDIYTSIENAEIALKALKTTMQTAFDYAGCDSKGDNCAGPKRVKVFKERAMQFFEPYENVLDEIYDALITAQSVGVDITDIYMMLNGTCNAWAQYLCQPGQVMHYTAENCQKGQSIPVRTCEKINGETKCFSAPLGVNSKCVVGQIVPMSDGGCQLVRMLTTDEEVQRNWLYPDNGDTGATVRVGCASEALNNSTLFRGRKKQATIDIETLQRIIEQDAPSVYGTSRYNSKGTNPQDDGLLYCAITEESLQNLQSAASLKNLPKTICKTKAKLESDWKNNTPATSVDSIVNTSHCTANSTSWECKCRLTGGTPYVSGDCSCPTADGYLYANNECVYDKKLADDYKERKDKTYKNLVDEEERLKAENDHKECVDRCKDFGGTWKNGACDCNNSSDSNCRIITAGCK